jgi:hypothetical protein
MRYVSKKVTVDSDHGLIRFLPDKSWRHAEILGGKRSRSGLTVEGPLFVEERAELAISHDMLPSSSEELDRLLRNEFNTVPKKLAVFRGHGTQMDFVWQLKVETLKEELDRWNTWRASRTSEKPPEIQVEEGFFAKAATRDNGCMLTFGEAVSGLPMRAGPHCELTVEFNPDTRQWDWEIRARNLGRARGSADKEGERPLGFFFEKVGIQAFDSEEDGITWTVLCEFAVTGDVEAGLFGDYYWTRKAEGVQTQYSRTKEAHIWPWWTTECPWPLTGEK